MRLILYTQYYRARTPERQAELDHCLRSNLQHPMLDAVVVLREPDAPPLPGPALMQLQVVEEAERFTYAAWMRLLRQEADAIGILINSDIALAEGFEQLEAVLSTPESVMALSRYNPEVEGQPARLNKFPHWTQDTWALRSDAPIRESLLCASSFPIGFPGCDNRIAYVLWSHGYVVKNPCYQLRTLHHQDDAVRSYDKNADRLYGGVSYVHPILALSEASEMEHTIWTRSQQRCPGLLVNQQAVDLGVHQLLAKDGELAQQFLKQQKSTGMAWSHPPLGGPDSAHAVAVPLPDAAGKGWLLTLNAGQRLRGLQLRLPVAAEGEWHLELEGQQEGVETWQPLKLGREVLLRCGGGRQFVEATAMQEPWHQLRLRLRAAEASAPPPSEGLLEVLAFCERPNTETAAPPSAKTLAMPAAKQLPLQLQLEGRQVVMRRDVDLESWSTVHRYSSRFVLVQKGQNIAFVDRFWPSAVRFRKGAPTEWDGESLREAFLWGFVGPVLEWKPQQFSTEKLFAEQVNFWQYPCRTEQDAFERHQRIEAPFWDRESAHVYVGMPWATWIDKKTFPDQLLEATRSRLKAMSEVLGMPLQVHSVCQHIRWKEHPHRFEQAGITQLWIAHKEKGWDREGQLQLHAWPLFAVNVLDPARREGLEIVPVEKKTIFASFKGAHMKHYPTDVRLRLKELAHLEGYEIEVTDLWHFNKVVYNYQIANNEGDKDAIEQQEIVAYNRLLSHSLFSICPGGAGPNTLRLWESLGMGSIPVIFSDRLELPDIGEKVLGACVAWEDVLVRIPESVASDLQAVNSVLRSKSPEQLAAMQASCIDVFRLSTFLLCF